MLITERRNLPHRSSLPPVSTLHPPGSGWAGRPSGGIHAPPGSDTTAHPDSGAGATT